MNARLFRSVHVMCALLCSLAPVYAQKHQTYHVDPRNMYERVLAVVPWIGSGTHGDPKRPLYTPAQMNPASRSGILAFQCMASDDGKLALCEFVAKDGNALKPLLADPAVKAFLKGRDKIENAVAEFKKHKKDFDINQLAGVRVP